MALAQARIRPANNQGGLKGLGMFLKLFVLKEVLTKKIWKLYILIGTFTVENQMQGRSLHLFKGF